MSAQTLYDKLWNSHVVREEEDGTVLLYIDRHLVHEVTSPQAFEGLKMAGRKLWRIDSVVSTADHNTPTGDWDKGIQDPISKLQVDTLDKNIKEFGALAYFPFMDELSKGIMADDHIRGLIEAERRMDQIIRDLNNIITKPLQEIYQQQA